MGGVNHCPDSWPDSLLLERVCPCSETTQCTRYELFYNNNIYTIIEVAIAYQAAVALLLPGIYIGRCWNIGRAIVTYTTPSGVVHIMIRLDSTILRKQ